MSSIYDGSAIASLHFGIKRIVQAFASWLKTHERRIAKAETALAELQAVRANERLAVIEKKIAGLEQIALNLEMAVHDAEDAMKREGIATE